MPRSRTLIPCLALIAGVVLGSAALPASAQVMVHPGYRTTNVDGEEMNPLGWSAGFSYMSYSRQYRADDMEVDAVSRNDDIPNLPAAERYPELDGISNLSLIIESPGEKLSGWFGIGLTSYTDMEDRDFDPIFNFSLGASRTIWRARETPSFFFGIGFGMNVSVTRYENDDNNTVLRDYFGEASMFLYFGIEPIDNLMIALYPTVTPTFYFREGDDFETTLTFPQGDREFEYQEAHILGLGGMIQYRYDFVHAQLEARFLNDVSISFAIGFLWPNNLMKK